jgi:hypothetical protein
MVLSRGIRLDPKGSRNGGCDGDASRQSHSGQTSAETYSSDGFQVEVVFDHWGLLLDDVVVFAIRDGVAVGS